MTEYLVIRLQDDGKTGDAEWVVVNEFGARISEAHAGPLTQAANMATGRVVIGLVPAMRILRTTVDLPVRGAGKQLQALPFAMEDRLAEDIDDLHFAIGERKENDHLTVAVVNRDLVADWLTRFGEAGLEPAKLYSDGDALGEIPGTSVLLIETQCVTLRDAGGNVTTADADSLRPMLELWLGDARLRSDGNDNVEPLNLLVYSTPETSGRHTDTLDWLRGEVSTLDEKHLAEGAIARLAAQCVTHPGVNLLQGAYAPTSGFGVYWPAWKSAAVLAAVFLVALFGAKGLETFRFRQQAAALDGEIEKAFRQTFPEVREIQDPRALLDSKLRALGAAAGGETSGQTAFLDTLQIVAQSISAAGDARLEAVSYRSGVMDLRIRVASVEILDRIQKRVTSDPALQAEIQSANADGDQVLGRLQIKAG